MPTETTADVRRPRWRTPARWFLAWLLLAGTIAAYGAISGRSQGVPSASQQLAGLIDHTINTQLRKEVQNGVDPAATRITSDCNEVSADASATQYICFAYLTTPQGTERQEWAGHITTAGRMQAHQVSPPNNATGA
jgi:hypothetical protein